MSTTATTRYGLPYIVSGQAQKEVTNAQQLNVLDALIGLGVLSATTTTAPASPNVGDAYLVPTGSAGWTGVVVGQIAVWLGYWVYITPTAGVSCWVVDVPGWYLYQNSKWTRYLGAQQTGWTAGTGTTNVANKAAMNYDTATTATLAKRLNAMEQALFAHGLIGA